MTKNEDNLARLRWVPVKNTTDEEIPPFAVMRVTGKDADGFYLVDKPNANNATVLLMFNGPGKIVANSSGEEAYGVATPDTPTLIAFDTADGTPANGQEWGVAANEWKLKDAQTGFKILGAVDSVAGCAEAERNPAGSTTAIDCTLTDDGGIIGVDLEQLAGSGLIIVPSDDPECDELEVDAGCHIYHTDDGIAVDLSSIAGSGLLEIPGEPCSTLEVNVGCHLQHVASEGTPGEIQVEVSTMVGQGLEVEPGSMGSCDKLAVKIGCGLDFNDGAVVVDFPQVAGNGLIVVPDDDCFELEVDVGCGIEHVDNGDGGTELQVDNTALAGEFLAPGSGCSLDVEWVCIRYVSDISCEDGELTVTYRYAKVLEDSDTTFGSCPGDE